VTLTLDFGQRDDMHGIREQALAGGAIRAHVLDVREAFARDCVLPALWAGAWTRAGEETGDRPVLALSHALIGKMLADVAAIEGSDIVAHGGRGLASLRLEAAIAACGPHLRVIAVREDGSRGEHTSMGPRSGGVHPDRPGAATEAASVEIRFERGVPTALFDIAMPLHELVECVSTIGGREEAGAAILDAACRSLESAIMPPERLDERRGRVSAYAELMRDGGWFSDARARLDASAAEVFTVMTGTVRVAVHHTEPPTASIASLSETVAVSR
jgi:argininosuccinate synthase